jgi:hypothetical protein
MAHAGIGNGDSEDGELGAGIMEGLQCSGKFQGGLRLWTVGCRSL